MSFADIFKKSKKSKKENQPAAKETGFQAEKQSEKKTTKAPVALKDNDFSYRFLISPYLTEKTAFLNALNQYVFKVPAAASKIQIRQAVERLYGVKVEGVKIAIMPSKKRQLGRQEGTKSGFKKAIVKLRAGDKIETAV